MANPSINLNFEDDDEHKLRNFMIDLPTAVRFRRPTLNNELWAFWCEPRTLSPCSVGSGGIRDSASHSPTSTSTSTTNQGITDKIKSALLHCNVFYPGDEVLIQFWTPMRTETGCLQLVTSDQPFGISKDLDERLLKYRKRCLEYKFNVDGNEEQHIGIPGLVFQQKWHHCTPDVPYYSTKEYPQRNFALTCDISSSFVFPVFDTSIQDCVGVVEFVTTNTHFTVLYGMCKLFLMNALKSVGLQRSYCDCSSSWDLDEDDFIRNEIKKGLKVVCTTHNVTLALMWFPCRHSNAGAFDSYNRNDGSTKGQVLHVELESSYILLQEFFWFSVWNGLQKGQGVVGKAYLSHKLFFCRDITQFTLTQFPLLPGARRVGLTACFAICLQNTCTGNNDYILEFFLHPQNTYGEDPTTFLCSILDTMKQHFPSFKIPSVEELVKELSIEFIEPRMNQEPVPGVLQNGRDQINFPVSCSDEAHMNQEPHSSQCQSTTISPPVLQVIHNAQETTQPHPPNQHLTFEVDDNNTLDDASMNHEHASFQCQSTASLLNNGQETMKPQSSNHQQKDFSKITYEELIEHSGQNLVDVALLYDVSRSTFKRKCRELGINRWQRSKRYKVKGSTSRRDGPPYSNLPATDAHTTPLVTPPPEVRTLTIIAKYGADVIKFKLPSSSTMVELEEKVTKRFKLNSGTYKIKYNDGNHLILIACDEDLQDCLDASNSLGTIEMFIEPITQISLST